ncbi:MAG: pseudouridine synthase [Patescibacteria group bacterium]|nr:pseudouridine synthase [Patescibacteria group bacterium]
MIYPIRINKYLADKKICSRREADKLIERGVVKINGKLAQLGDKVQENDNVFIEGDLKNLVYLAFNKPKGIVTNTPQEGESCIADILQFNYEVFALGRLDKESRGLILLTNDGRVTDRLLNPIYYHEKEYVVKVNKPIDDNFIRTVENGIKLDDGYVTKKCILKKIDDFTFSIILTEGKNRQIRRMCRFMGFGIADLKRVRTMNIELGDLEVGKYRMISGEELEVFLSMLNL